MTTCMHLHVTNEEKVHRIVCTCQREMKGLNPCEQHVSYTYWEHRTRCISQSQSRRNGSSKRETTRWTLGINVGRSTSNPFTFRTPPGHFAGTFSRENDESDGKLRKDNGSCPIELPSVRGTSTSRWRANVATALVSSAKWESLSRADERFVTETITMTNYRRKNYCSKKIIM